MLSACVAPAFRECWPFVRAASLLTRMNILLLRICLRDLVQSPGGAPSSRVTLRSLIGTMPARPASPTESSHHAGDCIVVSETNAPTVCELPMVGEAP